MLGSRMLQLSIPFPTFILCNFQKEALAKWLRTTPFHGYLVQSQQMSLCLWQTAGATEMEDAVLISGEVSGSKRVRFGARGVLHSKCMLDMLWYRIWSLEPPKFSKE